MNIYIISSEYIEYIWIYWIFDLSIAPVRKVLLCNVCEHLRRSVASGFVALFAVGSTWWSLDGCCLTGAIMNQTWINMVQWLGWAHCWRYIYRLVYHGISYGTQNERNNMIHRETNFELHTDSLLRGFFWGLATSRGLLGSRYTFAAECPGTCMSCTRKNIKNKTM